MDPSKPAFSRLEFLQDHVNEKSLMNKFITADSLTKEPLSSFPRPEFNPHPYGLPMIDPNQENRVARWQRAPNGAPGTGTRRSDDRISEIQSQSTSPQSTKDNSLDRRKSELDRNSGHHGFTAVNQPQCGTRLDSRSSTNRSHKRKAPPVAVPEVRVTKQNKSRRSHENTTISKKPTKPVLQAIDSETEAGKQWNLYYFEAPEISNVQIWSDIISERLGDSIDPRRFIVGLDFGTTTTAVSYFAHPVDEPNPTALPEDIKSIMNWPNDNANEYMYGLTKQGIILKGPSFPFFGESREVQNSEE